MTKCQLINESRLRKLTEEIMRRITMGIVFLAFLSANSNVDAGDKKLEYEEYSGWLIKITDFIKASSGPLDKAKTEEEYYDVFKERMQPQFMRLNRDYCFMERDGNRYLKLTKKDRAPHDLKKLMKEFSVNFHGLTEIMKRKAAQFNNEYYVKMANKGIAYELMMKCR
jgi:hypothetical protein